MPLHLYYRECKTSVHEDRLTNCTQVDFHTVIYDDLLHSLSDWKCSRTCHRRPSIAEGLLLPILLQRRRLAQLVLSFRSDPTLGIYGCWLTPWNRDYPVHCRPRRKKEKKRTAFRREGAHVDLCAGPSSRIPSFLPEVSLSSQTPHHESVWGILLDSNSQTLLLCEVQSRSHPWPLERYC
jgi:hypothetical protein